MKCRYGPFSAASADSSLSLIGRSAVLPSRSITRTPLRWIGYKMEYRVTRHGWVYISGIILVALAALNTGNNLLFLILATLVAAILMSGILSSITLSGVEMRLALPEHIFAGQAVRGSIELRNEKLTLPSFSLRVEAATKKGAPPPAILDTPVYFPYLPKRRGLYRQDAFRIVTRFPFGFLQKARRVDLKTEALVYPSVEQTKQLIAILPGLQGSLESIAKGQGQDLYALRDYVATDSARHVHWKASARFGTLMVREFTRDDDCRVLLVLDPHIDAVPAVAGRAAAQSAAERFEHAVTLCASLALQFRSAGIETTLAAAGDNIFEILRHLAVAQPLPPDPQDALITELAAAPDLFKIIITSLTHGSIPAAVWHSSYVIFLDDVA